MSGREIDRHGDKEQEQEKLANEQEKLVLQNNNEQNQPCLVQG